MGPAFAAFGWLLVASLVSAPAFLFGLARLRSIRRAFVLAATFGAGALAGLFGFGSIGAWFTQAQPLEFRSPAFAVAVGSVGAIAGGVIAVLVLGWISKYPPWRQY